MFILSLPDRTLADTQPQRAQPVKKNSPVPTVRPAAPFISDSAARPAQSKGMGNLARGYPARPLRGGELARLLVLGCLAGLGPLGYGLWQARVIQAERGVVAAQSASQVSYGLALVGVGVFGLLVILRLAAKRGFVAVHENGLAVRHAWGPARWLSWNAISGIASEQDAQYFLGWQVGVRYRATLFPTTGKAVRLPDGLEDYPELISRLKASLYPRLLPSLAADLQAGKNLYFGRLAISRRGLTCGGRRWTWAEVEYLDIRNGRLEIKPAAQRVLRFSCAQIPNLELFMQLVPQCAPERAAT